MAGPAKSLYRHTATASLSSQTSRAVAVSTSRPRARSATRSHGVAAPATIRQASSARIGIGKQNRRKAVFLRFRTMRLLMIGARKPLQ